MTSSSGSNRLPTTPHTRRSSTIAGSYLNGFATDMRILLVEDHPSLAEAVIDALRRASFTVDHAANAASARHMVGMTDYALVILDLGLPDGDGLKLLPKLRDDGRVPVIVLTARDALEDRLAGLDGGADDYIVKPIEMPELIARCRVVLRRPGKREDDTLRVGPLVLDTRTRIASVDGVPLVLGRRELGVLEQLMRAAGRVTTRKVLEDAVYSFDDEVTPNALEAAVSRLRKALQSAGCTLPIVTLRGVGWMLADETGS